MSDPVLSTQTDICVKCGLCLPHCPTYLKTQDENESPRGRLSLIQGWANDQLAMSGKLSAHIDNCLLCRACESACPAYVPYGQIVDRFRSATHDQTGRLSLGQRMKEKAMRGVLSSPVLSSFTRSLLDGAGSDTLKTIAGLAGAGDLAAGLPASSPEPLPTPGVYPAALASKTGEAMLFLGCTAELADRETAHSAIRLMNHLGIEVTVPEGQTCCGALDRHAGEAEEATSKMAQNLAAFTSSPAEPTPIVSFASGCSATLSEYGQAVASDQGRQFGVRIQDICQFLDRQEWPSDLTIKPLPLTVCVHSPCSLKNVLRANRHAAALLRRIPELKVVELPAKTQCCGAAGSYMVDHPEMAAVLRDDVLDAIAAIKPDLLVTSNPGCAMHMRAGLKKRSLDSVEVLHPITLLARHLRA